MNGSKVYDIAQICLNGHVITLNTNHCPMDKKSFCPQCGATAITECPNCHSLINGQPYFKEILDFAEDDIFRTDLKIPQKFILPAYCPNCGKPYPWTKTFLEESNNIVDNLEDLSPEQKQELKLTFPDLIVETPKTYSHAFMAAKIIDATKSVGKAFLIDLLKEHAITKVLKLLGVG